ncbi:GntR family transcriptional regulator [Cryobacterium sp. PH29-G1]|uniref:GntR family transcriptional regulator n=1 Tax=Cryobacterium sp. PH29-G1 TaxID=3046211 RepID=UPI0024BAF270|nr:GntR family transcriptional regulator [Cryobacterium sp. PH29-G1]MDJ0348598.1 GntR family transcriptional regulator [Cryobacterium sp. PH29-G1]
MTQRYSLEPVIQESTPSIIARKLRYAIAHGEVAPGSQLGEAELARELGVSRGPLREAMQRLTQEGLLVSIRNRGLFVIEMTDAEIRDMYVLRTAIESAACKLLVRGDHVAAGQDLLDKVTEMENAAATDDRAALYDADIAFHEHLVAASGSPGLARIHGTVMTQTRMCLNVLPDSVRAGDEWIDEWIEEHRGIAQAVLTGNAVLAERRLNERRGASDRGADRAE